MVVALSKQSVKTTSDEESDTPVQSDDSLWRKAKSSTSMAPAVEEHSLLLGDQKSSINDEVPSLKENRFAGGVDVQEDESTDFGQVEVDKKSLANDAISTSDVTGGEEYLNGDHETNADHSAGSGKEPALRDSTDVAHGEAEVVNKTPKTPEQKKSEFLSRRCISEDSELFERLRSTEALEELEELSDSNQSSSEDDTQSSEAASLIQPILFSGIRNYCQALLGEEVEDEGSDGNTIEDAWSIATKRKGVYNLVQVPLRLEKLLLLGILVCADEFLHLFTFLPLRCLVATVKAPFVLLYNLFIMLWPDTKKRGDRSLLGNISVGRAVDIVQLSVLILCAIVINSFDISWIYHNIRGQSVIKIYVVFNVMEIFDRLCCSLGVDVLDSLGWTTTSAVRYWNRRRIRRRASPNEHHSRKALRGFVLSSRVLLDYLFTFLYTSIHASLLLTWVCAFNVAINTQNNALITLLVSNNFIELKSSALKSFKVQNLFQISCADAVERFQHGVFLIAMLTYTSGDRRLFVVWGTMYICEILVDWIKHAFVTKFNRIHYKSYKQFSLVLCNDIVQRRKDSVMRSVGGSAVSKRVGFISLPLGALLIRMAHGLVFRTSAHILFVVFLNLCVLKVTLGILLTGYATRSVNKFRQGKNDATSENDENANEKLYESLSKVDRYDLVSKR